MLIETINEAEMTRGLSYAFMSMERMLGKMAEKTIEKAKFNQQKQEGGEYPFIPFSADAFIRQVHIAHQIVNKADQHTRPKFIDVGCGIGTKLVLAQSILVLGNWKFCGIDTTAEYINVAQNLFPEAQLEVKNALKHNYSDYDIIYFYCPMFNSDLQKQLERQILKTAKSGAVIIANLKQLSEKLWLRSAKADAGNRTIFIRK